MSSDKNYQGTDVNLEISLEEYGFVARPITIDYADEYFVIYKMDDNQYGSGHIRESELDAIVNGTEWASEEDVNSMLETVGASKEEWFDLPFTSKFSDLVSYWGTENIMGTDYYPNDKNWAFEEIGLESDDNDEFAKGGGVNDDEDEELLDDLRRYIYEHRHTKGITAEIIDKTKNGFKVKQIDEYGWGNEKKKTPRTTTAFYTEKEFSDLFKIKWLKDGYSDGGGVGQKVYNEQFGIGKSKYVVNFYDGVKTHNDGSAFFDIRIFKNIPDKNKFINELKSKGYVMKYADGGEAGKQFIIQDWAGNHLFRDKVFDSFEDGWEFIYENVKEETEDDGTYDDYYVVELENEEYAKGGGVDNVSYEKIYEVLKDKIEESTDDLGRTYENSSDFTGEEIEHKFRDGFIPYTNGGYELSWYEYVSTLNSTGYTLPTEKLQAEMQRHVDYSYELAKDNFKDTYPEIVEIVGEDNIDYNSLDEAGFTDEAQELSDWEMEYLSDEDTIRCSIIAYYYEPTNEKGQDGKHTISLQGDINLEAPYHRKGKNDDFTEVIFTFDSMEELNSKMDDGLKQVIAWFNGDKPTGSDDTFAKGGKIKNIKDVNLEIDFTVEKYKKGKETIKVFFDEFGFIAYIFNGKGDLLKDFSFDGKTKYIFNEEEDYGYFTNEDSFAKGGKAKPKAPKIVRTQFEEGEYEYADGGEIKGVGKFGLDKIIKESKENPTQLYLVTDDNYSNIGHFYLKNGKFAKRTVDNENYDFENSKVTLKPKSDVIYKSIKLTRKLANGGGVDDAKYFYVKGRNEDAPKSLQDTYSQFDSEKELIDYLNKWKDVPNVSFVNVTKVYSDGKSENVSGFYLEDYFADGGGVEFIQYKENEIMYSSDLEEYYVDDEQFKTLEEAKAYIDNGSPISDWKKDAYRRGMFKTGGGVGIIAEYEDGVLISKPYYFETNDFFKSEGYRIDNKFAENYWASFPIFKGGMTKKQALSKANSFYDFVKKAKTEKDYEDLSQQFIEDWNKKFANGGGVEFRNLSKSKNFDVITHNGRFEIEVDKTDGTPKFAIKQGDDRRLSWKREELKDFQDEIYQYAMRSSFADGGGVDNEKPYQVYNYETQNIEGYFDNEMEAEEFASKFKNATVYDTRQYANGGGVSDWFWNHDYRHYLRDASPKKRSIVKQKFIDKGLKLDGSSPQHAYIVISTIKPSELKKYKKVGSDGIDFNGDFAGGYKFSNGGGVDDADWIEESLIDLQNEVDMDDLIVDNSNNSNSYVASNGDAEFLVFESENDAREQAIERVKEDLEENPEYFSKDWLMNYIDGEDFFTEVYNEWNESYANDIESEDSDKYGNRLIEEMVENGIVSSEEAKEDDFDAEDYKGAFVELMTSNQIWEDNGLQHYIDNFGEEQAFKVVSDNNLIDIDKASEDAVDTDGVAHFLSSYDGEQIDLSNGHVAYRTN